MSEEAIDRMMDARADGQERAVALLQAGFGRWWQARQDWKTEGLTAPQVIEKIHDRMLAGLFGWGATEQEKRARLVGAAGVLVEAARHILGGSLSDVLRPEDISERGARFKATANAAGAPADSMMAVAEPPTAEHHHCSVLLSEILALGKALGGVRSDVDGLSPAQGLMVLSDAREVIATQLDQIRTACASLGYDPKASTLGEQVTRMAATLTAVAPLVDAAWRVHEVNITSTPETTRRDQDDMALAMDRLADAAETYQAAKTGTADLASIQEELRFQLREAQVAAERWKEVASNPMVHIMEMEQQATMGINHPMNRAIVAAFASLLGEAPNFVTLTLTHPDQGEIRVTVRRASGKSPEDLCTEYRKRLEDLGVTDLAPLPPTPEIEPVADDAQPIEPRSHMVIRANPSRLECGHCGSTEAITTPVLSHVLAKRLDTFRATHKQCPRPPMEKP